MEQTTETIMNVVLNGKIIAKEDALLPINHRLNAYGDGIFESIRIINGNIQLFYLHFQRMISSCKTLNYSIHNDWTQDYFKSTIHKLLKKNNLTNARLKMIVFREDGGLYAPTNNSANYYIEAINYPDNEYIINKNGLKIGNYEEAFIYPSIINRVKSNSAIFYVLAAQFAKQNLLDDVIIYTKDGCISESSSSNIFIVSNKRLYTPSLSSHCLNGTMRQNIIQLAKNNNRIVIEKDLTKDDLNSADEIWLTNAIKGIQWVGQFGKKTILEHKIANEFIQYLNK